MAASVGNRAPLHRDFTERPLQKPLTGDRWRLVTMDTGHLSTFSQPSELAQILLDAAR